MILVWCVCVSIRTLFGPIALVLDFRNKSTYDAYPCRDIHRRFYFSVLFHEMKKREFFH